MTPLRATLRLQLHADFPFDAARAQLDYVRSLGISHLYLSPIGEAVPGSTHGYDQVDPTRISDALGGEAGFVRLATAVREAGMGLVLDIVPNHMATHAANPWWWDVLRNGRQSPYAGWFDIDWRAPGRDGRLWWPVLDRPLRAAIEDGVLKAVRGGDGVVLDHHGLHVPVQAARYADLDAWCATVNASPAKLLALVLAQPYRLAWWRTGNSLINYRRFFDVTGLAALRIERRAVFDAVHALPLRLLGEGWIDGVRIDHVDGLADPGGYLRRLRHALDARAPSGAQPLLLVEKILAPGESLRDDWMCDGTSGYDFMDQVGGVLLDACGEAPLRQAWRARSGRSGDFAVEEHAARVQVLRGPLAAERARTGRALDALIAEDAALAELGGPLLRRALDAVLAEFPVYRTYAARGGLDAQDRARWRGAADRACARTSDTALHAAIDALVDDALQRPGALGNRLRTACEHLSAPLNAKAVEDTAFYRHGVLLSRNEVGSHPVELALAPERFHASAAARGGRALLATSTHDHKRGADVRARLAVLASDAAWWTQRVDAIEATLPQACAAVDGGDRWMLWQTIVGAWPPDLDAGDADGIETLRARIAGWQQKALREAKLRSSWLEPDAAYESACGTLLRAALEHPGACDALAASAHAIAACGAVYGLAQATLQLCVPGVPDLYQGCEGWDLSLVDPDNRRPVDYARRRRWMDDAGVIDDWRSGRPKARLWHRLLALRGAQPALFAGGDYAPLHAHGDGADRVLAFTRRHDGAQLIVAVPRAFARTQVQADTPAWRPDAWPDTRLALPSGRWRDVLGERMWNGGDQPVADLWSGLPVAVLIRD
ncbi:malto-oligosyltrehalose synthase [Luteimonas sp BLCC-B24]|uniref:malto-oligosyltrehalose synthase n=1 Tax=Luteimonas sp. BLCC-B24 TaxID=3025317 RepID=UPI00234E36DD|nr:malto-oligosyltrehalose synthase [Luteimonas sp. BLCC-B24]MDC7807525.1 malto-oligosyltrehalose synthase [Luteimonas sp. BLCC-B24]